MHPRHAEMGFPLKIEEIVAVLLYTCSPTVQEELSMAQLNEVQNVWLKTEKEKEQERKKVNTITYDKKEEDYTPQTEMYSMFREGFLNDNKWFVWPRLLNSAITKIALTDPQEKPKTLYHAISHINFKLQNLHGQRNYDYTYDNKYWSIK